MSTDNVPEARRLMINLMYLVLTALLALNVTREVLNAFTRMNNSIVRSNGAISTKNTEIYDMLDKEALTVDSLKVRPWNDKAHLIKARTSRLMTYLEQWKDSLIINSGGYTKEGKDSGLKGLSDINTPTELFVNKKYGVKLQDSMQGYVNYALNLIDSPQARASLQEQFPLKITDKLPETEENPKGDWAFGTFHNIPVIAAIAMISKFQNDLRNSESMILERFRNQVHAGELKFNTVQAIATPNTTYALEGQEIDATILLAAYNKNAKGMSITSSAGNPPVVDGVGHLKFKASGIGSKTVNGKIYYVRAGKQLSEPFHFDYTVGTAGASMQLDKMNVMYIGVPNPVTLSASGYNIEDVSLHWQGGSGITEKTTGKGKYDVTVSTMGTYKYTIMAQKSGGASAQVGGGEMRVKRIPDPVAEIAGKATGLVKTGLAKAQLGVNADLKNFVYDARFVTQSFTFIWLPLHGQALMSPNEGARWSNTVQEYINRSQPGDQWIVKDVKAKGPAGETRTINSITITLN